MTGRTRLLTALAGKTPDRVPISTYELVGHNSRAWENHETSYRRLMQRIRADTDCIAMWNPRGNATLLASVAAVPETCHETRHGTRTRTERVVHTPGGDLRCVTECDDRVHTTWVIEPWCKCLPDVDAALSVPYEPVCYDVSDWPRIRAEVADHGIVMPTLADPALIAAELMSFQHFTIWAFEQPDHFGHVVDIVAERVMENLRRQLQVNVADLYRIVGPEYFTPPYLPPRLFERFVVPHVTAMTELIHAHGSRVRLHCHGRIGQVLGMMLDTGCDGIDPCEPPPDGDMELDEVKRRCAARGVSVFGNIELKLLEAGTPTQVRAAVARAMDQAKAGGGFVLMPTAAPIDVSLSPRTETNYMALIDTGLELGGYN